MSLLYDLKETQTSIEVNLVIYRGFQISESLLSELKKANLFRNITLIDPYYRDYQQYKAAFVSLEHAISPKRHWIRFGRYLSEIPKEQYDILLAGVATVFLMDLKIRFVTEGCTIFYEEGEGSYLGNFVKSAASNDSEILIRSKTKLRGLLGKALSLASGGKMTFDAREIYLYRPELVSYNTYRKDIRIRRIDPITGDKAHAITVIFRRDQPYSRTTNWIFLGNPDLDLSEKDRTLVRKHLFDISRASNSLSYRPHPRSVIQEARELPKGVELDKGDIMWEVKCADGEISDKTVLFGYGSTAQSNPKRMFNIEPYIVSLHLLLSDNINRHYAEEMVSNLKKVYSSDKIFVPKNDKELNSILKLLNRSKNETEI